MFTTVPGQAIALGGDAAIDLLKGHTVNDEKVGDEGMSGYINPFFHNWLPDSLKGPQVHLSGIHLNGDVDLSW